jgi:hypothetical protein
MAKASKIKSPKKAINRKPKQASAKKPLKIPYHYKPDDLSLDDWQKALREQFVRDRAFGILKLDDKKVFGDYQVYNPEKDTHYKVALRSLDGEWNFCTCLDFKTNQLGTCKHLEAVLKEVQSRAGQHDDPEKRVSAILYFGISQLQRQKSG